MTTKRKKSAATARAGVSYVRGVVEQCNCTFQEIDGANDLGNDAYIEFTQKEEATGCCIAVQIKSGSSYVTPNGNLILRSDRAHFEYWRSHILPVCAIVYDPRKRRAGWCDLTAHLDANSNAIDHGPYQVLIPEDQQFVPEGFAEFRKHFLRYRERYSGDANFGASLEWFVSSPEPAKRIEGLRSLFNFHRQRVSTWYCLAGFFRYIDDHSIIRLVVRALSLLPGHGDISWGAHNEIDAAAKLCGLAFIKINYGRNEVIKLLSAVDDNGFERGTVGQAVHAVINVVSDAITILHSIAFDKNADDRIRYTALWLFIYYAQEHSVSDCIRAVEQFRLALPNSAWDAVLIQVDQTLREAGALSFY